MSEPACGCCAAPPGIHPARLFSGSCFALIATAVNFAVLAGIIGALKKEFVLTNEQVGWIVGAGTWGFTISIFALGPLVDALGMRLLLWGAFAGHGVGTLFMIFGGGFWTLFAGALVLSLANGTVEAVCNPLVATVFPDRKTEKLNHFHVWFPGGIVIGGLACFLLGQAGIDSWQVKLALILVPTAVYGFLFLGQTFPATERVQSGVSFAGMFRATLLRPLFLVLFFCMMLTASLELGPNRWIPSILEAGGLHGILVLVWISGLMAVLRFYAGPVVHRLSPTGILLGSAILSGLGLFWLSFAESSVVAFAAATVFALGVCYFWPTMLGVTAERVPKGGALALGLMGGMGMLAVGVVTTPLMGRLADGYLHERLPAAGTRAFLAEADAALPGLAARAPGKQGEDIRHAHGQVRQVLAAAGPAGSLPQPDTANALRAVIGAAGDEGLVGKARALLDPADNYGGRLSFRWVAPLALILVAIFGALFFQDLARGGYRVEAIGGQAP